MVGLVTFFCPCVTCAKTWHRLHYNGDMSGYEIVNVPVSILSSLRLASIPQSDSIHLTAHFLTNRTKHKQCIAYGYSVFCCTPLAHQFLVCIPNAWQTFRIRRIGDLGGTCAADCAKTWLCPCCSLIQNEKESKLLIEGRRTGFWGGDGAGAGAGAEDVIVQQPTGGLGEEMVMSTIAQAVGVKCAMVELPVTMEGVDGQLAGSEADSGLENTDDTTKTQPHTDEIADPSTLSDPITSEGTLNNETSTSPIMVCSVATTTMFEPPTPPTESITTSQHFGIAPTQDILSYAPSHSERSKKKWNSDTTGQRVRRKSERVVPNHLDCFVPYMKFLE